jgi:hypothetical protein
VANRHLHSLSLNRDEVSASDMQLLLNAFGRVDCSLMDRMHVVVLLIMFSCCLRFDEAAEISVDDELLVFRDDYVQIFIPKSKTDQELKGRWVFMASLPASIYCPVAHLKRLLESGGYVCKRTSSTVDCGPLLRPVKNVMGTQQLQKVTGSVAQPIASLSYARLQERCKIMCKAVGITKCIGLHSFRIGAASAAADKGASVELVKKFGAWKSDSMPQLYSKATVRAMVNVSRSLGLAD